MTKKTIAVLFMSVAAIVAVGGYIFSQQKTGEAIQTSPPASADALFKAGFDDVEGKPQALAQWRGKVMVVNFWATWCPPCREEMPEFVKLQAKYKNNGLVFVGIAIDQKDKVIAFSDEIGVNYPILLGELNAVELTRKLGNRLGGLPYTIIIDRGGHIAATEMGALSQAKLEQILKPLL